MRKIFNILCVLILPFSLLGCSSNTAQSGELETKVCTYEDEDFKEKRTFEYEGDEVRVYTNEMTYPYELLMLTEDEANKQITTNKSLLSDIAGLTYEGKIEDDKIIEKTVIDLTQADMEQLVNEAIIPSNQNGSIPSYISLEQLVAQAEAEGMTCE